MNVASRLAALDWSSAEQSLNSQGFALLPQLLSEAECRSLRDLYPDSARFRSRIDMRRYRFGRGEYQYFAYPLPDLVAELRQHLYSHLVPLANLWMSRLSSPDRFPPTLAELTARCHAAGQSRPTPLLLHYGPGDFNCLHQDLYGAIYFPFQVVFLLSDPERAFSGGELVLVEQQPRAQSIPHVVRPRLGEAVILSTRYRPAAGSRGFYRTNLKHGVSTLHAGERYTLGVIFHDAQ